MIRQVWVCGALLVFGLPMTGTTLAGDKSNKDKVWDRNAAENLAWLRRVAITLLKKHPSKGSLANKSFRALLDPNFLQQVLEELVNSGEV